MGGEGGLDHDNTYERPDLNQAQDLQLYTDDNAEHRHCEAYNPVTDTWERTGDLGHGLVRICGGGVARGRVVVVGLDKNGGVVVSEWLASTTLVEINGRRWESGIELIFYVDLIYGKLLSVWQALEWSGEAWYMYSEGLCDPEARVAGQQAQGDV